MFSITKSNFVKIDKYTHKGHIIIEKPTFPLNRSKLNQNKKLGIFDLLFVYHSKKKTHGWIVYKQVLINAKLQNGKRGQKKDEWEKSIKEAKVCIGL